MEAVGRMVGSQVCQAEDGRQVYGEVKVRQDGSLVFVANDGDAGRDIGLTNSPRAEGSRAEGEEVGTPEASG